MKNASGILEGIRILDMGVWLAGTGGSSLLGSLGAEVIKVEDPVHGDTYRGMITQYGTHGYVRGRHVGYETANLNKKSITIDLKKPKGREILHELVAKSDVFHTNYQKDIRKRLGVDYASLKTYNEKLIYCVTTIFGSKGPLAERRGFDPIGQARSGLMWSMGDQDYDEPMAAIGSIIDNTTGTMMAFGMVCALLARDRLGIGQEINASLLGTAVHMQTHNVNITSLRGKPFAKLTRKRSANPLSNHYKCGDGKWIMIAEAMSQRYWEEFCDAVGIMDLKDDPRFSTPLEGRKEHKIELIQILEKAFGSKSRDEWVKIFEEKNVGFAYSPIYDLPETVKDPQVLENDYVVDFDHDALGKVQLGGFPISFGQTPAYIHREAPEHGQHTEEILQEVLGYDWDKIGNLRDEGVI